MDQPIAPGIDAPAKPSKSQAARANALINDTSQRIAAWPEHAYAALLPHLMAAQHEVAANLAEWLATVKDGDQRFTYEKYAGTLLQLQGAIDKIHSLAPALYDQMIGTYTPMGKDALNGLKNDYARMLDIFGGPTFGPGARLDLDTALILANRQNLLIPQFRTSAARYAGNVIGDIQAQLVQGVLAGETYHELVNRLVRMGGPTGVVALRGVAGDPGAVTEEIAEGLFKRYRYWAHRIVRTELQGAANKVLDDGIRKLAEITPGLVRRWDASMTGRTCAFCFELHGTTADIDGEFAPGITDAPAHPCCMCRVGAWHPSWSEYLDWMKEIQ